MIRRCGGSSDKMGEVEEMEKIDSCSKIIISNRWCLRGGSWVEAYGKDSAIVQAGVPDLHTESLFCAGSIWAS